MKNKKETNNQTPNQTIAFFGTGLLGEPMAHQLIDAGFDLIVYNRTVEKTAALREKGARVAETPKQAMDESNLWITMLTDYPAIRQVLMPEYKFPFQDKTLIQVSTLSPEQSLNLQKCFESSGGAYMEAPVLGSIPQAKTRTLFTLFSGSQEQFDTYEPILTAFSEKKEQRLYMGPVGKASAAKLALNQLIATLTAAFSMSLGYCRVKGVEIDTFMNILRNSALYAPTFDKKFDKMMNRDFQNPNFPLKHLLKDIELIIREFEENGVDAAPAAGVRWQLNNSIKKDLGDLDYSAMYNFIHPG